MQINYIILAHKNPKQVQRLINRLENPNCNFYIHIDKGVDATPFFNILSNRKNIFFIPDKQREYGTWGDIGIVMATIKTLSQIVTDNQNGYCVLMSGQDYPLQNNQSINDFFDFNYGANFIETFSIPYSNGWGNDGGLHRLNQYKINLSNSRMDFIQLPSFFDKIFYKKQTIRKLLKLIKKSQYIPLLKLCKKRRFPYHLKPYGGGQWWAFPIETVQEILNFIHSNPKYTTYHKDTLLPDEIFFHSILMKLKETNTNLVIKPSVTYVNWTRKNTPLPVTFKIEDIEELRNAAINHLFARKFDIDIDEQILNNIDF